MLCREDLLVGYPVSLTNLFPTSNRLRFRRNSVDDLRYDQGLRGAFGERLHEVGQEVRGPSRS